jgi:hypothetical protein
MNKKSILSLAASVVFLAAMSYAQSTSGDQSQGTQGSSPTTQQDPSSSGQGSGSMGQGSSSGSMGQGSSAGQSSGSMGQGSSSGQTSGSMSQGSSGAKGEKKMKGCITSEGGQYALQDKHGKSTPLSGQDLSAHVGHEVTVHGTWGGGSSDASAASSGSASGGSSGSMGSGKSFNVTNVDMISESCTSSKTKGSGSMQK